MADQTKPEGELDSKRPAPETAEGEPLAPEFAHKLELRSTRIEDYDDIKEIMDRVYPTMGGAWKREQIASQISRFPEGQLCIEDNGKVIAAAISLIVDYARWGDNHTYKDITGDGYITTHDPSGDTLYGVDIFVHPDYRDLRLGRRLYDARKELCEKLNLRAIVAGGRIVGYKNHAAEMPPSRYIELVKRNELHDPVLSFQLANDFHVRKIIKGYEPTDTASHAYATLLEWINIYYEPKERLVGGDKAVVRVGAVQWQMRPVRDVDDLLQQVEFFIDTVGGYNADFCLLPEFFNAPLMAQFNQENPAQAIRELAGFTERLRDEMVKFAMAYNVNVIAGSMPEYEDNVLRNVSYLCRRDGTWDRQYKLHITPDERSCWGLQGGESLRIFETDVGKVGILICYDIEFPELARVLAGQGMSVLFVPYWTDTKNAYLRVRRCAQARAVENECYVVMTGSVGNLPRVENMDIQYSQSGIFTPSDYAFPQDAIAAEATPNTEMTLVADLDLEKLKEMRMQGSVRNFQDRRVDLYSLRWTGR
ncbi:MAG: bifunctional GNAT family N-acetyltransferase/carbon-nitrogen hydrolase family protein [Myxococcales bacterium]|nr:bifunctional GNAT family N-acetyltransferase/carbon-nitrogen hydrolase family protein [Myxococcales bacterium]